MDGQALVEQQEQWLVNRRFIFLFPLCHAPREISRLPRLAHKAPVMQATITIANWGTLQVHFATFAVGTVSLACTLIKS